MRRRKPIKKSSKKLVLYSKRRSQKSKLLLLLLSFQIVFSPLLADANIVVDQVRDKQTSVDITRSGVDQVNISSPSAAGVSHNSFDKFNVSQKGVVINNSAEDGVSVIGGAVYKNPNFQKDMREASIILNEVTGSSTSDLQGWTEIFGRSAEYVLANPNGIYVNGAGFINTPKVTLTTGVPAMRGGEFLGVGVSQGKITVGSQGVDISGLSYFGILARAAELSGQIADNLGQAQVDVTLGLNDIDYQSKQIKASHQSQEKPEVALDASALGSIFGGSIKIISTEQGVGVNSRGMLWAGVKDVEISSSGKVVCKDVYAKKNVDLQAEGDLVQLDEGLLTAEIGNVNLSTGNELSLHDVQTGGVLVATSGQEIRLTGQIAATRDIDLESYQGAIRVVGDDQEAWSLLAGEEISLKGSDFFNENGKLCSAQDLAVKVLNKIQNDGEVVANGDISLQAKEIENKNLLSAGRGFLSKSS